MQNGKVHLSLNDLKVGPLPIEIVDPMGKRHQLTMRPMFGEEMQDALNFEPEPQPPIADMRRNPQTNAIEKVYNLQDLGYLRAMTRHSRLGVLIGIVRTLQGIDIPGESDLEKAEALDAGLEAWAISQFTDHFNRINGFGERELTAAKEAITPLDGASTPS